MRRDDNQIGTFLCSSFVYGGRTVSSNGRCIDRNTIETHAVEEIFHLTVTPNTRGSRVSRRIVIAASRGHHDRAEIDHMQNDNVRAELLRKSNCIVQTRQ